MSLPALLLYGVVAVGAAGIYFLLPRTGPRTRAAGAILALAALAGLVVYVVTRAAAGPGPGAPFYLFAGIAVICAACVITQTKAVYSALYFVIVVLAVAGLLILMEAEFLAVALVIIYAGAILVTYVFVIMLASQSGQTLYDRRARAPLGACLSGFLLVASIATALGAPQHIDAPGDTAKPVATGNTEAVGALLMTDYVIVLELAGVLLLLAMVGAIAIARKQFPADKALADTGRPPVGQAGKTAAPY